MSTKSPNNLNLINREIELILQGGQATKLLEILKEYEFSLTRSIPLTRQELDLYFSALIIENNFNELKFVAERNSKEYPPEQINLYIKMRNSALKFNFTQLLQLVTELEQVSQSSLKSEFIPAVKRFILETLSNDYINISLNTLKSQYNINEDDIRRNHYEIEADFVILTIPRKLEGIDQVMQDRIRQLSNITEGIIKN